MRKADAAITKLGQEKMALEGDMNAAYRDKAEQEARAATARRQLAGMERSLAGALEQAEAVSWRGVRGAVWACCPNLSAEWHAPGCGAVRRWLWPGRGREGGESSVRSSGGMEGTRVCKGISACPLASVPA